MLIPWLNYEKRSTYISVNRMVITFYFLAFGLHFLLRLASLALEMEAIDN